MRDPRQRKMRPGVEGLDERCLLSATWLPADPSHAVPMETESKTPATKSFKIYKSRTVIAGTVIPARLYGSGKGEGALLVADNVAWPLELGESKELPRWAKALSHRQVVVFG